MQIRRCELCKDGIPSRDPSGGRYVVCALIPPTPVLEQNIVEGQLRTQMLWVRPSMSLKGWCGQFRLAVHKLFFDDGPRA